MRVMGGNEAEEASEEEDGQQTIKATAANYHDRNSNAFGALRQTDKQTKKQQTDKQRDKQTKKTENRQTNK